MTARNGGTYDPYHYRVEVYRSSHRRYSEIAFECEKRYFRPGRFRVAKRNVPWIVACMNMVLARDNFEGFSARYGVPPRVVICAGDEGNLLQFMCPTLEDAMRAACVVQDLFDALQVQQKNHRVSDTMEVNVDV